MPSKANNMSLHNYNLASVPQSCDSNLYFTAYIMSPSLPSVPVQLQFSLPIPPPHPPSTLNLHPPSPTPVQLHYSPLPTCFPSHSVPASSVATLLVSSPPTSSPPTSLPPPPHPPPLLPPPGIQCSCNVYPKGVWFGHGDKVVEGARVEYPDHTL